MKPPKVTSSDFLQAFISEVPEHQRPAVQRKYGTHADRIRVHAELKALWQENLGNLFQCPSDDDLFTFLKMSKWDMQLICMAVEDLVSRAKFPFDKGREHDHAMRHFSSALIRRIRARYGPPSSLERAA